MDFSSEEENMLVSQITDLRLTTLEAIARESCAQNRQVQEELENLGKRVQQLQRQGGLCGMYAPQGKGKALQHSTEGRSPSTTSPSGSRVDHMCDYCFAFSGQCFACPRCGREWYCSDVCQRLRQRCHAGRCRACLPQEHEVVLSK